MERIIKVLEHRIDAEQAIAKREKDPELRSESEGYITGLQEAIILLRKAINGTYPN